MWHYEKFLTCLYNGGLWENIFWSVWDKLGNVCQEYNCIKIFYTKVMWTMFKVFSNKKG